MAHLEVFSSLKYMNLFDRNHDNLNVLGHMTWELGERPKKFVAWSSVQQISLTF